MGDKHMHDTGNMRIEIHSKTKRCCTKWG